MFPYPSGKLHLGHFRVYTLSDVISKYYQLKGHKVLHPIGWDSFGLPAENAAQQHKMSPKDWTLSNITEMKRQFKAFGVDFNWECEIATTDKEYIKWTQYLFLLLYKHHLAYRKKAIVNWDPIDQTVLANEQVRNGRGERSGAVVEKKLLTQWFFKTTEFRQELLHGLEGLDWPDAVISQQREWMELKHVCRISKLDAVVRYPDEQVRRTCILVGPKHPLFHSRSIPPTVQPLEMIPLCDTILCSTKGIDIDALDSTYPVFFTAAIQDDEAYVAQPHLIPLHSKLYNHNTHLKQNLCNDISSEKTYEKLFGMKEETKLHDWLVSRQRKWGTPIPVVYCDVCGIVPVPMDQLPILHTHLESDSCPCPKCNREAKRETDTLDTFVDSSWYWLRYLDPHNPTEMCSKDKVKSVDVYVGGVEHSVMHLVYARFIAKVLKKYDGLEGIKDGEPFLKLVTQGVVKSATFSSHNRTRFYPPGQIVSKSDGDYTKDGIPVTRTVEKMSKSKFNGVDTESIAKKWGESVRMYIMYRASVMDSFEWNEDGVVGMKRVLERLQRCVERFVTDLGDDRTLTVTLGVHHYAQEKDVKQFSNEMIYHLYNCMETNIYHRAITWLIKWISYLDRQPVSPTSLQSLRDCLVFLYPFAPTFSNEMHKRVSDKAVMILPPIPQRSQFGGIRDGKSDGTNFKVKVMINRKHVDLVQVLQSDYENDQTLEDTLRIRYDVSNDLKVRIIRSKRIVHFYT
jgi:leucyl-tRNA synthetase